MAIDIKEAALKYKDAKLECEFARGRMRRADAEVEAAENELNVKMGLLDTAHTELLDLSMMVTKE